MARLQKVKMHANEMLIKKDFDNLSKFACADLKTFDDKFHTDITKIIYGFEIYQDEALTITPPSISPIYVKIAGSSVIHSSAINDDPEFYVGPDSAAPVQILLTNSATNFIEFSLVEVDGAEDTRIFWDQTAENNVGKQFAQVVDTVTNVEIVITSNTVGFTAGKVPISEITLDSGGNVTSFYDRRNLFFRLGQAYPYNEDYEYPFPNGRVESVHDITLETGVGFYHHFQSTPSTTWTIVHNLGEKFVIPQLYNANGDLIDSGDITSITATNTTTLTVVFGLAQTGYASILVGAVGNFYQHTQAINATWTVTHSLTKKFVNYAFYNASDVLVQPSSVTATSTSVLTATFGAPTAGHAVVSKGNTNGRYDHVQVGASTTWTVTHNLGYKFGVVQFYDAADIAILPNAINIGSGDSLTATFGGSESGNAIYNSDSGGSYVAEENVLGNDSLTSAKVSSPGSTAISIYAKSASSFTIGETLIGLASGSSRKILTIKENFNSADKTIKNLKESLDAIMTEIKRIKFGTASHAYWFENSPFSLADLDIGGGSSLTLTSTFLDGGGTISWNSGTGELSFTSDFTIPVIGTAFTNVIQVANSPITLSSSGDLAYVDVDAGSSANIVPVVVAVASYAPSTNRFIIARRVGTDLYIDPRLVE